jgi:hypothetical protein
VSGIEGAAGGPVDAWERLLAQAAAILAAAAAESPELTEARIVAIGWATVELERAERELGRALGVGAWTAAPRDGLLGAQAAVFRSVESQPPDVVALEPDTEGRVAGSLARHGEGVAAIYVTARPGTVLPPRAFGIPARGPLGEGRRLAGGRVGEPSVIVVTPGLGGS